MQLPKLTDVLAQAGAGAIVGGSIVGALYGRKTLSDEYTSHDRRLIKTMGGAAAGAAIVSGGIGLVAMAFSKGGRNIAAQLGKGLALGTARASTRLPSLGRKAFSLARRNPMKLTAAAVLGTASLSGISLAQSHARKMRIARFNDSTNGIGFGLHQARHG